MSTATPGPDTENHTVGQGVAALLGGYSVEITSRSKSAVDDCRRHLPPGSAVFIASIPGDSYHSAVATAAKLAAAQFVPVPHLVARNMASFTQLNDFLARLRGEAGVSRALVVGGDAASPVGPFGSSLELLRTGAFQKHGLRRVAIACYAEPNGRVDTARLEQALSQKVQFLRGEGFEASLMSQFCFDPALIVALARRLRAEGIDLPLRVGLAGPVDARTLWKYALHCGIGNSMRALGTRVDAFSNLLVRHAPDAIIAGIAQAAEGPAALGIEGLHFFAFGDIAGTARWAQRILDAAGDGRAAAH